MVEFALMQIGDRAQPDKRIRAHIYALPGQEFRRPGLIKEYERPHHLPLGRGQGAPHFERPEVAGARHDQRFDGVHGHIIGAAGVQDRVPAHAAISCVAATLGAQGHPCKETLFAEANAFDGFMTGAMRSYGLDAARISYLGYSNGANLLGAVMLLQPGLVQRAILLRGTNVLDDVPTPDLAGTDVLLLSGTHDPFTRLAPELEAALQTAGATLDTRHLPAGHDPGAADLDVARIWLDQRMTA